LDDALLASLKPFRIAMEREEQRASKHPDQVSVAEMRRVREMEAQLVATVERGDDVEVARLEAVIDAILLISISGEVA
jgi:hypothetical protein